MATTATTTTAREARHQLTDHPRYKYRGCAPDPDRPTRAAGNNRLSIDAWSVSSEDGGEDQKYRLAREAAAIDVCMDCPVMVQCLQYAMSVLPSGKIAEEYGIFGGTTSLERHRRHIATVQAQQRALPSSELVSKLATVQRMAVLEALAAHHDPHQVADAAGVDDRTANWQRSKAVALLGLDKKTTTRRELLAAVRRLGLLDGVPVVDGPADVLAVPPPGTARPAPVKPTVVTAPEPPVGEKPPTPIVRTVRLRFDRSRFRAVEGQLSLTDARPRLHLVPPATTALGAAA